MKKILSIILLLSSFVASAQRKTFDGVYEFRDTLYLTKVVYNSGAGIVHLGIDTVAGSPTFGKLVRKTASGSTPTLQQVTDVGSTTTNNITALSLKSKAGYTSDVQSDLSFTGNGVSAEGALSLKEWSTGSGDFVTISPVTVLTATRVQRLQDADGTIALKQDLKSKAVTIESPSSSEAVGMWQTPVAITVSSLKAILRGSTPSVTYNIRFGTDITSSTDVFTANITCTSVTTGCSNSSGFNDATIPAGSFIWIITSAQSGTVNSISFTINYTED